MEYFHGYSKKEFDRLLRQAEFLSFKVFEGVNFKPGTIILEPGCGVGAQTRILLRKFPDIKIIAVDRSQNAIEAAKSNFPEDLISRVEFHCADIYDFHPAVQADGIFICWMLEHVHEPLAMIKHLLKFLKPGGFFMATEVQNNSLQVYPHLPALESYWNAYNLLQEQLGGDPFVGLKVPSLLEKALPGGFEKIQVRPGLFLNDLRNPEALKNMSTYWLDLMESTRESLESKGLVDSTIFPEIKRVMEQHHRNPDALFSYTFVQTTAYLLE